MCTRGLKIRLIEKYKNEFKQCSVLNVRTKENLQFTKFTTGDIETMKIAEDFSHSTEWWCDQRYK